MNNMLAVHSNTYHGFNVDTALEAIVMAGIKYVEMSAVKGWTEHIMPNMPEREIIRIREKIEQLDLSCIALSGHCNLMDRERLEDFKENIKLAYKLGCRYIVSSVGEAHFDKNEAFMDDVLADHIKALIPELKRYGLELVLETHGVYGTGPALLRIIEKTGSDLVGINYDTANVVAFGMKRPEDDIKTCVEHIKYVHLKDKIGFNDAWNFPVIGQGDLKIPKIIEFLNQHDYQGPFSIEIEFTEDFAASKKTEKDLAIVNKAILDSKCYLSSLGLL